MFPTAWPTCCARLPRSEEFPVKELGEQALTVGLTTLAAGPAAIVELRLGTGGSDTARHGRDAISPSNPMPSAPPMRINGCWVAGADRVERLVFDGHVARLGGVVLPITLLIDTGADRVRVG